MKASPAAQKELLRLQSIDNQIRQMQHAAKSLPQLTTLTQLAAQSKEISQRLGAHRGEVEDAKTELKRIENDVEVVEVRIRRDSERVQSSSSAKNVQALESELVSLRKRRFDLEEIELTVMEKLDEIERATAAIQLERDAIVEAVEAQESARDAELAIIETKRLALVADRVTVLRGIPEDLVALYEKQLARYGTGAALLRGGISAGSNMKLTENELNSIRQAAPDEVLLDPESQCILVRTDESGL